MESSKDYIKVEDISNSSLNFGKNAGNNNRNKRNSDNRINQRPRSFAPRMFVFIHSICCYLDFILNCFAVVYWL